MSILPWLALVLGSLAAGLVAGRALRLVPTGADSDSGVRALAEVLDAIPDAAMVVDQANAVLAASGSSVPLGLVEQGMVKPVEVRAMNREAIRTGQVQNRDLRIERTGGVAEIRVHVSPLVGSRGLVVAQDMGESQRLDAVRRDFVANVSHELKTPVGALGLLSEAVLAADGDGATVRKFATRMQFEVQRLADLVADLVELSRVESGAQASGFAPVAVRDVVLEAVAATELGAAEKGITVTVADTADAGAVYGDEDQLAMALRNLISNAIRYSPSHTHVGVGVRRANGAIEVSVTDQGPGIAESDQQRIFERFYRADPARSRETGGTGLGLAIVKHVCANHGGECTVWSRFGHGSTFTLHLPEYVQHDAQGAMA